jgi:DNA adenine methylase
LHSTLKTTTEINICKPFLRWAGGKIWLLKTLKEIIPKEIRTYHEPFLGGASVFLGLNLDAKAYLSDLNQNLILTYEQVRDNLDLIVKELKIAKNNQSYYYLRNKTFRSEYKIAAQLIYLNRTCFNGIYRVNKDGAFNVPYGNKHYTVPFDYLNLINVSLKLQNVKLYTEDFMSSLKRVKKGDFVFLDPPYTTSHENNGFIKYNEKIFTWQDQIRLLEYINEIKKLKAYFVMTNAAHIETRKLFKSTGKLIIVERSSTVGSSQGSRRKVNEYIFTNC